MTGANCKPRHLILRVHMKRLGSNASFLVLVRYQTGGSCGGQYDTTAHSGDGWRSVESGQQSCGDHVAWVRAKPLDARAWFDSSEIASLNGAVCHRRVRWVTLRESLNRVTSFLSHPFLSIPLRSLCETLTRAPFLLTAQSPDYPTVQC